jgi:hypothetical protein
MTDGQYIMFIVHKVYFMNTAVFKFKAERSNFRKYFHMLIFQYRHQYWHLHCCYFLLLQNKKGRNIEEISIHYFI